MNAAPLRPAEKELVEQLEALLDQSNNIQRRISRSLMHLEKLRARIQRADTHTSHPSH